MGERKSSPRGSVPISLIAIHTNEGNNPLNVFPDRTAEDLAAYLDRPSTIASYHKIVDDDSTVHYLPDNVASWSIRSGNSRSLNLCMTGWARWSREEWLSHSSMLQHAALLVREWCMKYRIPLSKISPVQVGQNHSGICGHIDWTLGKRDGTHTDPGTGFPWDVFIRYVVGDPGSGMEIPVTKIEEDELDFFRYSGKGREAIPCPTGSASANNRKVFVSVTASSVTGPAWVQIFAQSFQAGIDDWKWTEKELTPSAQNLVQRPWKQVKSGTSHLVISWDLTNASEGATLLLETIAP